LVYRRVSSGSSDSSGERVNAFSGDAAGDNGRRENGSCWAVFIRVGGGGDVNGCGSSAATDAEDELDEDLGTAPAVDGEKNRMSWLVDAIDPAAR
jgi:hypothetical protein